ncbi:hypothetical protein ACJ73_09979 [Blastomyces percursus]|uniref:Uncharacterized protein n=1 Tax=Blastomyces percursus TaxID=1658174 RepID=A0A1J9P0Z7_9EURO|nr:hypothetical protein ACJ73_09979 [Blastomyces percursus]
MGDSISAPFSAPAPTPTTARRARPRLDTRNLGSALPVPDDHDDVHAQRSPSPSPRVAEELPTVHEPYKRFSARHAQNHDLGPKWHKEYSDLDIFAGRVLIIDFVKQGASSF